MNEELLKKAERFNQDRLAPARLDRYLAVAQARKSNATDDEKEVICILEQSIQVAQHAIEKNDIDDLLHNFELIIRCAIVLQRPELKAAILSEHLRGATKAKSKKHKEEREKIDLYMIELYENSKFKGHPFSAAGSIKLQNQVNARAKELGIDKIMTKR
jgi:hypothetical protein